MTFKTCCLRQHMRDDIPNRKTIYLSLDDTVLKYLICGPNLLGSHVEEHFELFEVDDSRVNAGSSAILHTQNGFACLEALSDDVSVESLGRSFDGASAHIGMKVRPSTKGNIPSTLQLLPGQSFYLGKTTLSLVPDEHSLIHALHGSNLESYNHQVSQISTSQRTARVGSTVMETPIPHGDYESKRSTPILEQITKQAISDRKDSTKWPESLLKREVMRTMRDASENDYSSSQLELRKEDEHMTDATINEPSSSSSNPKSEVKIEDEDVANAAITKPLREGPVDLEDPEKMDVDPGSEYAENSEPISLEPAVHQGGEPRGSSSSHIAEDSGSLSPPRVHIHSDEESIASNHSPMLAGLKPPPSSVAGAQPETRVEAPDQSTILQAGSDSSQQTNDDLDDARVRKKAKTATVSQEVLAEDSEVSLQDEVISVKREILVPTDHPLSTNQALASSFAASSTNTEHRSRSTHQLKQRSLTSSVGSKRVIPSLDSDSRPQPADRPSSGSSFNLIAPKTPLSKWNTVSASPPDSVEPSGSMRSTRSTARDERRVSSSTDAGIRVVFASSSSAGDSKLFLKFLSSKGVKKVDSIHDCTVLCVGKELKKTSKLILAVLLGKDIVTDSWVTDSVKGNDILSLVPYMARDPKKEAEWNISLDEAIYRGKTGLKVLQDHTILFTPSAKKELGKNGFDELKEIVKCAGAKAASPALPRKSPEETSPKVVIATQDSPEAVELQKLGWRVYVKDVISLSVLRGKLDLDSDEFLIKEQKKESKKRKR